MVEVWKDIAGYEGLYQVSNYGRVLSINFGKRSQKLSGKQRVLKASKSSSGYFHVQLYKDKKSSTKLVHVLVASAFLPKPNGDREVNHIDGNKANNYAYNLEWVTKSENARHASMLGLRKPPMEGIRGANNPNSIPIAQYDLTGNLLKVWPSHKDAADYYGCDRSSIAACTRGNKKTCMGFMWKRIQDGIVEKSIPPIQSHAKNQRSTAC